MVNESDIPPDVLAAIKVQDSFGAIAEELSLLWRRGDGEGDAIFHMLVETLRKRGFEAPSQRYDAAHGLLASKPRGKAFISGELRRLVLERDAYRCKLCESYFDLTVDHILPESKGGGLELSNLQTLCRSCNSKKGVKIRDGDS